MKSTLAVLVLALSVAPLAAQEPGSASLMRVPQPTGFGLAGVSVTAVHATGFTPLFSGIEFGTIPDTSLRYISLSNSRSTPYLAAPVDLEHGMLLTALDVSACNSEADNTATVELVACQMGGACSVVASVVITPALGCKIVRTDITPVTINLTSFNYHLRYTQTIYADTQSFDVVRVYWKRQMSPAPLTQTFADVPPTHGFFRVIEAFYRAGITGGCGGGNFCPDSTLTRKEVAAFFAAALGLHHAP
jgi:hypothetical protein